MLADSTTESIYEYGYITWNGYRLSGADGSKIQLPSDEKLREIFGTVGGNNTANTAPASILFDVSTAPLLMPILSQYQRLNALWPWSI
jgi:hypothetical protein